MELVNLKNIFFIGLAGCICLLSIIFISVISIRIFFGQKKDKLLHLRNFEISNPSLILIGKSFLILILIVLWILMIFRPSIGRENAVGSSNTYDIVLLVDISASMGVEDGNSARNSRIVAVQDFLTKFLETNGNSRYSVVTFSGRANTELPLTYDTHTTKVSVDTLTLVTDYNANGTLLSKGLIEAEKRLFPENQEINNRKKIIILLSDGEEIDGNKTELDNILSKLSSKGASIVTVGVGSLSGGRIPQYEFNGQTYYYRFQGNEVISKLNEDSLKLIAGRLGGQYLKLNDTLTAQKLIDTLPAVENTEGTSSDIVYKDIYFILAPILIFLIIIFDSNVFRYFKLLRKK